MRKDDLNLIDSVVNMDLKKQPEHFDVFDATKVVGALAVVIGCLLFVVFLIVFKTLLDLAYAGSGVGIVCLFGLIAMVAFLVWRM